MFTNALLKAETKLINSTPYKPNTNGCIEKFNKTLNIFFYVF